MMVVFNRIDVEVRDVIDPGLIATVTRTVRHTFSHLAGTWYVTVSAYAQPGRWDVHVRGGVVHHVAGFLAVPDRLAIGLERQLRDFLRAVAAPHSVVPPLPASLMPASVHAAPPPL
jgi:hypothetical protein